VPLNATARRALRQLLEQEPAAQSEAAVFWSGHGTAMPVGSIQNAVTALSKYPPAKPGALERWPLKAAGGVANAAPEL
jgi:hypothetical protein